ncbi:MAG: cytochrome c [Planctomycetota bacterium]
MRRTIDRIAALLPLQPFCLVVIATGCFVTGCDAPIDQFGENQIFAKRLELTDGVELTVPVADSTLLLEEWFGTPDEPRWPDFLKKVDENLVSLERLQQASGAFSSDEEGKHVGLFREHCVVCHGVAGDGLGPSASLLNPYPRDFRPGKFKYASTPIGKKPTREDLHRLLGHGIVGTSMPSFRLLDEEDREALVDYVIFLSVRGELERKLLAEAALELDIEGGDRLYDPRLKESDPDAFQDSLASMQQTAKRIVDDWSQASEEVTLVPEYPWNDRTEIPAESIANGKKLFQGNVASCSFCHGAEAKGDGQQNNYDDWTRDWTVLAGLNPKEKSEIQPMLELGALKPRNIFPRNLQLGVFRGGDKPEDLYRRIVNGIEGTPMPAAPMQPNNSQGLSEDDVWDIVNFLMSLKSQDANQPTGKDSSEGGQA